MGQDHPRIESLELRRLLAFDLAITNIEGIPEEITAGQTLKLAVTIKNVGNAAYAHPSELTIKLSENAVLHDSDDVLNWIVPGPDNLAPGQSISVPVNVVTANNTPALTWHVGANIDRADGTEQNEANNNYVTPTPVLRVKAAAFWDSRTLNGTDGPDRIILLEDENSRIIGTVNGVTKYLPFDSLFGFGINAGSGNDFVLVESRLNQIPSFGGHEVEIRTFGGADTVIGGPGTDRIFLGNGKDKCYGGKGDDQIYGGANNDQIDGGPDEDLISGNGGNDKLFDTDGRNTLLGSAGDDLFITWKAPDGFTSADSHISGGSGTDRALLDEADDTWGGIEELLPHPTP